VKPRPENLPAHALLAPALAVMALCGVIPMMFVAFYSVNDTFAGNDFVFVGATWFKQVLVSREFHSALLRSFGFALLMLAIQIPLGLCIALRMPASGFLSALYVVLMAIPLLTPSAVVGYLW
jgi:glycerol transport system permease protein